MRFATLLASVALLGSAAAAPVKDSAAGVEVYARQFDSAVDALQERDYSPTLDSAIKNIDASTGDRGQFVQDIVGGLRDRFKDHNVFMYHRFGGDFKWGVSGESMEAEAQFHEFASTEYFQVVAFKEAGVLERTGGDGGWENWGFAGWYDRDGDKVNFKKPPA